jgi:serine O-acetyltransferase
MAADYRRLTDLCGRRPKPLHRGLWALRLYRVAHWLRLGCRLNLPSRFLWALDLVLTGADLDPASPIGGGAVIHDPRGVIIYGTIGTNVTIGGRAGIGTLLRAELVTGDALASMASLGDDVVLGNNVVVLGIYHVGDGVHVGDDCAVMEDIPDGAVLVSRAPEWRAVRVRPPKREMPEPVHRGLLRCIRADVARAVLENAGSGKTGPVRFWGHLIFPGVAGVAMFRVAHALHARGWMRLASAVARVVHAWSGMTIHPGSIIGSGLFVPHPVTVRFCGQAGSNLALYPHTSVGPETWPPLSGRVNPADLPQIGDGVRIGAGSSVVGPVTIGDSATVGVKAVVRRNLEAGLSAVPRRNWRYAPLQATGDSGTAPEADRHAEPALASAHRAVP